MLTVDRVSKRFALAAGYFARAGRYVQAVREVSFRIGAGETYGLVGESGSGKTTTARLVAGMYRPDRGSIVLRDRAGTAFDVSGGTRAELRRLRTRIGYVFQDPARSLNPRMTVQATLLAGLRYGGNWPGAAAARDRATAALEAVGLSAADLARRPPDFSGGQRQRIAIARALIGQPELVICDEIVSALDVSVQSQILELLQELRGNADRPPTPANGGPTPTDGPPASTDDRLTRTSALTLLFISHDLAVVSYFCDRVGVMHRGSVVEEAAAQQLARRPGHAYTRQLYAAVPQLARR